MRNDGTVGVLGKDNRKDQSAVDEVFLRFKLVPQVEKAFEACFR